MENNEEKAHRSYRIMEGDIITIKRNDFEKDGNKWVFYKVATKNRLDDTQTYYKQLSFPKGTDLPDGARIKIKNMIEYGKHKDRYNDTYYLFIDNYELMSETSSEAINEYRNELESKDENDTIW